MALTSSSMGKLIGTVAGSLGGGACGPRSARRAAHPHLPLRGPVSLYHDPFMPPAARCADRETGADSTHTRETPGSAPSLGWHGVVILRIGAASGTKPWGHERLAVATTIFFVAGVKTALLRLSQAGSIRRRLPRGLTCRGTF